MKEDSDSLPSPDLSRRGLLRAGSLAGGAALLTRAVEPAYGAAARGVDPRKMWRWHEELAERGPRLTGNRAHSEYIEFLAARLGRMGLRVHRDRLTFTRWDPKRWGLSVGGERLPVAFYYPYSGVTPPAGVTAPLVYLGPIAGGEAAQQPAPSAPNWELARGKIAVVEAPTLPVPVDLAFREQGSYPSNAKHPSTLTYHPSVQDILTPPDLAGAAAAGVVGVVCVRAGVSDGLAANQYSPFVTPYQDCPAVWVNGTVGQRLRLLAVEGRQATLTMEARLVRGAATETLYAVLRGANRDESVIVNTHTDGPNVPEENGGLGMLSLARQFRSVSLRRSLVFVFATGHFQLPQFARDGVPLNQASSRWMDMHPEWHDGKGRHRKAVAALTLEHLGCREWADNATHTDYAPTGENEVGWCYTTTPTMRDVWLNSARGTANKRTFAADPNPPFYFGEGGPFYKAGIATMSLIPGMTYLTAADKDGALSKLSPRLITGQIETFSRAIRALERTSTTRIGTPQPLAPTT
ncbi:hypothetical protein [Nocardioides allogilvus]|uniref:hypothetical protein n=1 Tax=Nocardioides allogilvus TaxID=2072017 RepID=UPI000D3195B8|nr:hypothetical protein [Nocardioides allogilvus]